MMLKFVTLDTKITFIFEKTSTVKVNRVNVGGVGGVW